MLVLKVPEVQNTNACSAGFVFPRPVPGRVPVVGGTMAVFLDTPLLLRVSTTRCSPHIVEHNPLSWNARVCPLPGGRSVSIIMVLHSKPLVGWGSLSREPSTLPAEYVKVVCCDEDLREFMCPITQN